MTKIRSWKKELDDKYEEVTGTGDIKLIDKANQIILEAIEKIDALRKRIKLGKSLDDRPPLFTKNQTDRR